MALFHGSLSLSLSLEVRETLWAFLRTWLYTRGAASSARGATCVSHRFSPKQNSSLGAPNGKLMPAVQVRCAKC